MPDKDVAPTFANDRSARLSFTKENSAYNRAWFNQSINLG